MKSVVATVVFKNSPAIDVEILIHNDAEPTIHWTCQSYAWLSALRDNISISLHGFRRRDLIGDSILCVTVTVDGKMPYNSIYLKP